MSRVCGPAYPGVYGERRGPPLDDGIIELYNH